MPPSIPSIPGIILCIALALSAMIIDAYLDLTALGASIIALLLGLLIANTIAPLAARAAPGAKVVVKKWIPIAIICIGARLDLAILLDPAIGARGLIMTISGMTIAALAAIIFVRLFSRNKRSGTLLAAGTAVCGNSAILAVAPVVPHKEEDLVAALATVNLIGLIVLGILPGLSQVIGMTPEVGGMWAGATVHAVPPAIAAGMTLGEGPGELATLFKLLRVSLLAPLVLIFSLAYRKHAQRAGTTTKKPGQFLGIPWFIYGFVIIAILNTTGQLDWTLPGRETSAAAGLATAGRFLLIIAMAGIGVQVRLGTLLRRGGVGVPILIAGLAASAVHLFATAAILLLWR